MTAAVAVAGAVLAWLAVAVLVLALCRAAARQPTPTPDPGFDEHTATALAVLRPDDPALPAARPLSYLDQIEAFARGGAQ